MHRGLQPSSRAFYVTQRRFIVRVRDTPSTGPSTAAIRETALEEKFLQDLEANLNLPLPPNPRQLSFGKVGFSREDAWNIVDAMFMTRIAHNVSRRAALEGTVFYTIGPGGHEGVAGLAAALRPTDPAFLHYRDTAFQLMRSLQAGDTDVLLNLMRSYTLSSRDKTTGGRHKALGDRDLNIIPKTSTIASHLPRAVGLAASLSMPRAMKTHGVYPDTAIVVASAGDGSICHATYRASVNFLQYTYIARRIRCPTLMFVADNNIAISTRTPPGWVEWSLKATQLPYFHCHGENVLDVFEQAQAAAAVCRKQGTPVFLHMTCARLFNHAGADSGAYYTPAEIREIVARDPLPFLAGQMVEEGYATHAELLDRYRGIQLRTEAALKVAAAEPKLANLEEVAAAILPPPTSSPPNATTATHLWQPPSHTKNLLYKQHITSVLTETLDKERNSFLIGQDIGEKGGNYGCTDGLRKLFGRLRVRDALLDETSILGVGLGSALNGFLPIVEICYLAYIHNAIDQIRGEAATLSFFSNGQFSNGMIVRISGGGLTEFGGHFHNENSLSSLLDIPGLLVVYPSNGRDYTRLFRKCISAAKQGRVIIILEPIKGYAQRTYGTEGTSWMFPYPAVEDELALGELVRYEDTSGVKKLAIVSYGNGVVISLEARELLKKQGIEGIEIIDRPTLVGSTDDIKLFNLLNEFECVLFADESRQQGCLSEDLFARLHQHCDKIHPKTVGLVAAANSFIPLGPAAKVNGLYLSTNRVVEAALNMLNK
eukprot:gb/GEZN01002864.1/.p1 GENE.gb/GEZN01002864.1/~~gb/GEZN01002864.1/.p1  ORF type:complete len:769 (+),score=46.19 gb/GEZN01002864.1/:31-2337(+)